MKQLTMNHQINLKWTEQTEGLMISDSKANFSKSFSFQYDDFILFVECCVGRKFMKNFGNEHSCKVFSKIVSNKYFEGVFLGSL